MRLIGVDPSLTATGMICLRAPEIARLAAMPAGSQIELRGRKTITSDARKKLPLAERLLLIHRAVVVQLHAWVEHEQGDVRVVIEDPSDFYRLPGVKRKTRDICVMGAAFGTVLAAIATVCESYAIEYHSVGTQQWLPKEQNSRGAYHFSKHEKVVSLFRTRYRTLSKTTDHETMAAGVALTAYAKGVLRPSEHEITEATL